MSFTYKSENGGTKFQEILTVVCLGHSARDGFRSFHQTQGRTVTPVPPDSVGQLRVLPDALVLVVTSSSFAVDNAEVTTEGY